jgi:hypothetical protein
MLKGSQDRERIRSVQGTYGNSNRAGTNVPKRLLQGYPGIQRMNSRANKHTGREQTKNLMKWLIYSALRSSIKTTSQGNNTPVASSNKTV